MKSKCINGKPHEWWCYIENSIEYQVCRKAGCQVIRTRRLLERGNRLMRFGKDVTDPERCGLDRYLKKLHENMVRRNSEIRELFYGGQANKDELATLFGITKRTIDRALNG